MNRRAFFSLLAGVAATAALDPEKLLWVPGKKLISIPNPVSGLDVEAFAERYFLPAAKALANQIDAECFSFYDVITDSAMYRFRMYDGNRQLLNVWKPSPVLVIPPLRPDRWTIPINRSAPPGD